jgi:hypothetical protein
MAHALELPPDNTVLQSHPALTYQRGAYTWTIARRGQDFVYSVTDGTANISLPIRWGFGAKSQTWVLEYNGRLYESFVSYYPGIPGLGVTMGDNRVQPATLVEAMGRLLSSWESRACYGCHATGAVAGDEVQLATLVPGVKCQHCHVNANEHFAAITQGKLTTVPPKLSRMTTEQVSNFCGQCHRSFSDVVRSHLFGPVDVRFQPYRLTLSRCYDGSDRRISCLACHDPHQELVQNDASYDTKCLACHTAAAHGKACPVAKAGCVSCHMPKVQLPGAHQLFTDHFIRIAHDGEQYPEAPGAQ